MNYKGKAQSSFTIVAPASLEAEGDHLFAIHAAWMAKTHPREGDQALLQYNVSKSSDADGHIIYLLTEMYETVAGIENHSQMAHAADWYADFTKWASQC